MDAFSALLTIKALDGLFQRSAVTAENVANAGSPNYRPLRVNFEQALTVAAGKGEAAVDAVQPKIEADPTVPRDEGLRLDLELATSSSTAMRYAALIEVLNRQMQLNALAATGNG